MKHLNRGTQLYILVTYAAALWILFDSLRHGTVDLSSEFVMLALIGAIMSPHTVMLGTRVEMSVAHPFILASILLLGETGALLMSVICIGSLCFLRAPRMPLYRAFFNISAFVVTTFLSSRTYLLFGGVPQDPEAGWTLLAMLMATLVFYLANTYGVAGVVAAAERQNVFRVWSESFLWSAPSFFAGGSLALGMAYFLGRFGIYSFVLAMPFCALIYYSYKLYLDKLEEKRQHLEDIQRMNADLERKVRERTLELERLNRRLEESNVELKRASSLKSEFLANMSHELRTPLNAIIGFSELLLDRTFGDLSGDQRAYAMDILSSGRHLLELINDVLDLSKIEAGRMRLTAETFGLGEAVEESLGLLRVEAARKEIRMEARIPDPDLAVFADRNKLKQILHNLLSNAVKFTPARGRVELAGRLEGGRLTIAVSDTGIGIAREDRDRIFQSFTQVDGSYARRYQGTGLGLALVKKFVEMHGGTVWVESEPGRDSRFTFTLPNQRGGARPGTAAPRPGDRPGAPGREAAAPTPQAAADAGAILVVEDNDANRKLVTDLLRSRGHRVVTASTAEDALDALKSLRPGLILIDIQLPGMDGLALTRLLKGRPETAAIPTVAVTAHAMREDEARARAAGCDAFIAKPIDPARLVSQVAALLGAAGEPREARGRTGSGRA
ncbi:MAG: ATP-binding protein [Acidobacteriota bacterium]